MYSRKLYLCEYIRDDGKGDYVISLDSFFGKSPCLQLWYQNEK